MLDDQQWAMDHIVDMLKDIEYIYIIRTFTCEREARRFLMSNKVDFLILDVELSNSSGFDFLLTLPNPQIPTILYTAHQKYEDRGYDMLLVDVLFKKVTRSRLLSALRRINNHLSKLLPLPEISLEGHYSYFLLKGPIRNERRMIEWKNIVYICMENGKLTIYLIGDLMVVANASFKEVKDMLPFEWFKQCAQGILFNRSYFLGYAEGKVVLSIRNNKGNIKLMTGNKDVYPDFYDFLNSNAIK